MERDYIRKGNLHISQIPLPFISIVLNVTILQKKYYDIKTKQRVILQVI